MGEGIRSRGLEPTKKEPCRGSFAAFQTAPGSEEMQRDFLLISGSLAALSGHPFAGEVMKVALANRLPACPVIGFREFEGKGLGGAVQLPTEKTPRAVLVGTREFLAECGLEQPAILEVAARRWEAEEATVLYGGWDGYVRGLMKFVKTAEQ